jgi:hypothetical protein
METVAKYINYTWRLQDTVTRHRLQSYLHKPRRPMKELPQLAWWFVASIINVAVDYYYADQVKKNVVGGACGTHGRGEKSVQGFGAKAQSKKTTRKTEA